MGFNSVAYGLKGRLNLKSCTFLQQKAYMLGIRNTRNMPHDTHTHTHTHTEND
jgi:hypothetical protein